jgi:hypothetical protein
VPNVRVNKLAKKRLQDDMNNFARVWCCLESEFHRSGLGKKLFGGNGTSVFRGGFSRAFVREGTLIVENSVGQNPGGSLSLQRSICFGQLKRWHVL